MNKIIYTIIALVFCACSQNERQDGNLANFDSSLIPPLVDSLNANPKQEGKPPSCIEKLINAARDNDLVTARQLLEDGCDVNGTISNYRNSFISPLRYGIHHEDSEMAKLLLSYGADPCQDLGQELNPLHYSISGSSFEAFSLLAGKCPNVNTLNLHSNFPTPLHWAIKKGKIKHVEVLLKQGALINPDSLIAYSPLAKAISYHHFDIFKLLLEKGADVNAQFGEGMEGDCIRCPTEITVLHQLALMNSYSDVEKGMVPKYLEELMKYNPDMNIENGQGFTALEFACFDSDTSLVQRLYNYGAKLETEAYSAIHCAAMFSQYNVVAFLLKLGADPNVKDKAGLTPIMSCFSCCGEGMGPGSTNVEKARVANLLIQFGADPKPLIEACKKYPHEGCQLVKLE